MYVHVYDMYVCMYVSMNYNDICICTYNMYEDCVCMYAMIMYNYNIHVYI